MSVSTRVIIVITILFTIISLGCKKDPTRMTDSEIQELKNRDYDVENMVLRNFKKSELEWRLKSRKVKAFTNPEISYASEVNVLYFSEENTTTLTARNGTLDYMSGNMTVSQDVVDEIAEDFSRFFMTRTKAELFEEAGRRGIMLYPVLTPKDMLEFGQLAAREYWVEVDHPELGTTITYPGSFLKTAEPPYRIYRRAPLIGEHNEEIYIKELGLSKQELLTLKQMRVI